MLTLVLPPLLFFLNLSAPSSSSAQMLPKTTRASSKTILSLGSSIPSFLLPSYPTWSSHLPSQPPSPPRSSSSRRPNHHQRRSSSTIIDAQTSPFPPPPPSHFDSLRSLSETLQTDIDVKESSRWVGRALEKDFVSPSRIRRPRPPEVPEGAHKYHTIRVEVAGREWSAREIVVAYAEDFGSEESRRRRRSNGESSSNAVQEGEETVDDLERMEGAPAGKRLREVLSLLQLDDETFLLWRKVVRSSDIREALSFLQLQTAPSSLSPRGDPLWPHWLITIVMGRSSTSLDAHLSTAIMAHHLPWLSLSPARQAILLIQALEIVVRFELLAAVPELVNLALTGKFLEEEKEQRREEEPSASSISSSSSQKSSWKPRWNFQLSSSDLEVGRHISTSLTSSQWTPPSSISIFLHDFDGTQRWHPEEQPTQFFATIIRILTSFTPTERSSRRAASPILTSQLSHVLSHMLAKSIRLLPCSYEQLFRARFLADENFKALLLQHADLSGLEMPMRFVNTLMIAAIDGEQTEVANDCADALDEMKKEALEKKPHRSRLGRRPYVSAYATLGEGEGPEEARKWDSMTMSEEDEQMDRYQTFTSHSVHFLAGLKDPLAAIEYLETLRLPPRTSPYHTSARDHASRAFVALARVLASPSSNHSSSDLLQVLERSSLFVSGKFKTWALDGIMKGLLLRNNHLEVFRLWQKHVEDEQLTPTVSILQGYTWACSGLETLAAGIKMMDYWSVRQGAHRIIHRGIDGAFITSDRSNFRSIAPSLDASQVLVDLSPSSPSFDPSSLFAISSTSLPPVVRVQLDPTILQDLLRILAHLADPGRCLEVAFRTWDASEPRWGVTQSIGMLDELLLMSANVQPSEFVTRTGTVRGWETRDLDVRLVEMEDPKEHELNEDGGIDWSRVEIERLFALPAPLAEGDVEDGMTGELWTRSKWLFEEIVTSNWPFLVDIPHPFDDLFRSSQLPPILGIKPYVPPSEIVEEEDRSHLSTLPPLHSQPPLPPLLSSPSRIAAALPPPSLYSHLYPTSETFHNYILILLNHRLLDEIPFAFAWMRHLSIYPQRRTIIEALAVIASEDESSDRRLREIRERRADGRELGWVEKGWRNLKDGGGRAGGRGDEEKEDALLRLWLELWLGVEGVPGRGEVEVRWEEVVRRRKRKENRMEELWGI